MPIGKLILIVVCSLLLLALIQGIIEPFLLRTTYQKLPLTKEELHELKRKKTIHPRRFRSTDQAIEASTLRCVYFSDLHINNLLMSQRRLIARLLAPQPDILLFGGDLISRKKNKKKAFRFMRNLVDESAKAGIPVFVSPGNHDVDISPEEWLSCGVLFGKNCGLSIELKAEYCRPGESASRFRLLGLDDLREGRPDIDLAAERDCFPHPNPIDLNTGIPSRRINYTAPKEEKGVIIALAHNPDTVLQLKNRGCDYFLSGHFHGGQIRLPFRLEFRTLRDEKLCRQGIYDGFWQNGQITSFISCGVGCVLFPLRFYALPELSVIDFSAQ